LTHSYLGTQTADSFVFLDDDEHSEAPNNINEGEPNGEPTEPRVISPHAEVMARVARLLRGPSGRRQLLSPVNDNYFCRCWGIEECGAT
jgi:hypothetical protein